MSLLQDIAGKIRKDVIRVAIKNKRGHIAPSLSTVDILVALYYEVMRKDDWFILSKGHGCYALYAILADRGVINKAVWEQFLLPGCLERAPQWGIPCTTGSLGHGLPQAVGLAWGLKLQNKVSQVYCLVGDGEMQEGANWEALMMATRYELKNLTVIVDSNKLQAMDSVKTVVGYNSPPLAERLDGFGLHVTTIDGHHLRALCPALESCRLYLAVLIANTVKGRGLPCAEDVTHFHYRVPTKEEYDPENL